MKWNFLAAVLGASLVLTGCSGAKWFVKGSCKSGGDCEVSGGIEGTLKKQGNRTLLNELLEGEGTFDAAQFAIEVSDSNIALPSTGRVEIRLRDSSTGNVHAASTFSWVRAGNALKLADPDSVNDWALRSSATSDALEYQLEPFVVQQVEGGNALTFSSTYEGSVTASSTTSWHSGGSCRSARCHAQ